MTPVFSIIIIYLFTPTLYGAQNSFIDAKQYPSILADMVDQCNILIKQTAEAIHHESEPEIIAKTINTNINALYTHTTSLKKNTCAYGLLSAAGVIGSGYTHYYNNDIPTSAIALCVFFFSFFGTLHAADILHSSKNLESTTIAEIKKIAHEKATTIS